MNTQYRKNLKAVLEASKTYCDKRIDDLEWELGTYDLSVDSDTTTAYQKVVPANSIEAKINTLGGMSYKVNQLVANGNFNDTNNWGSNVGTISALNNTLTFTSGSGNRNYTSTSVNGTLNHKYLIVFSYKSNLTFNFQSLIGIKTNVASSNSFTQYASIGTLVDNAYNYAQYIYNYDELDVGDWVFEIQKVNYFDLTADFGSGNEPSTVNDCATEYAKRGIDIYSYTPQQSGIRDTAPTSVKSVGSNLLDITQYNLQHSDRGTTVNISENTLNVITSNATNGVYIAYNFESGKTYTLSLTTNEIITNIALFTTNDTSESGEQLITYDVITGNYTFTPNENKNYLRLWFSANKTFNVSNIMLNIGSSALPYKPYFTASLLIPAQVQALDGYGWGINDTCYNYIDFNAKKFIKKVDRFNGNDLTFVRLTEQGLNLYAITTNPLAKSNSSNILNSFGIENVDVFDSATETTEKIQRSNPYGTIYVLLNTNRVLSDFDCLYELATPVETDISAYLTTNKITVEGGGTLTAENTYGASVPSDIDYLKEVAK